VKDKKNAKTIDPKKTHSPPNQKKQKGKNKGHGINTKSG